MFIHDNTLELEFYFRIFLCALLGFVIGFDRLRKAKPIGLKTYTLITVATCLVTIISIESVSVFSTKGSTMMDPMRLIAQLLPAVGFLGAGTIWFANNRVSGLTSAALVLFCTIVGIGIGSGFYSLTLFTYILVLGFLRLGQWYEDKRE